MGTDLMEWGSSGVAARRSIADRLTPRTRQAARRYAIGLFTGALLLAAAAEVLPWMSIGLRAAASSDPGGQLFNSLPDSQTAGQYHLGDLPTARGFTYWLTWVALAVLAGGALMAAPATRRILGGAAVGGGLAQLTNLAGLTESMRRGAGVLGSARAFSSDSLGLSAQPEIGLYCAFVAVGLLIAGVVAGSVRDWRHLAEPPGAVASPRPRAAPGDIPGQAPDGYGADAGPYRWIPRPFGGEPDDRGDRVDNGAGRRDDGMDRWDDGAERQGDDAWRRGDGADRRDDGADRRDDGADRPGEGPEIVVAPTAPFAHPTRDRWAGYPGDPR